MPDTLADLVRKKYPGKYDSLDDDTLEDKISTKYPGKYEHLMPPKRNAPPDALKVDNPDVDAIVADARKSAFGRSIPEEGLDAAGQPKFTIDDMPKAEKPKPYETVGPPLPQARNEQTPTAAPPSNHSAILDFADSVSRFLNNHPRVQEALTGTSPEFEAMKKSYGITDVKGPGFMRIPGLSEENVNKAAQAVTGESGYLRLGAGALTKALGDMAAVAFDPRATVPERTPSPPHNTFDVPYTVHPEEAPPPPGMGEFQPTSPVPVRQPPIESKFQSPVAETAVESRFPSVEQPPTIDAAVTPRTPRSTEIPYRMEPQAPPEEGLPVRQQTQQTVTEAPIQRFMRENPAASMSDIEKFIRSMSATQSAQQGIQPQPQQDLPVRAEDPFTAGATENRTDILPQPGGPEFAPVDHPAAPEEKPQSTTNPEENIYTQAINKFNMGKPLPTTPKVQASDLRPDAPYVPVSPFKTVEPQAAVEAPVESALPAKQEPPTATHIGSQPTAEGGAEDLFNIESGPDKGSTVTRAGLEQRGIPVPQIDQSKQGKSGEQLRAEALAAKAKKPSAFAKPEKAPETGGLAPALPDESVMDYHNRTGASIADSEIATGNAPEDVEGESYQKARPPFSDDLFKGSKGQGLDKKASFEDQWATAIKEAKLVGLNPSDYDNLDQLQWDTTRKVAQITIKTGKNPLHGEDTESESYMKVPAKTEGIHNIAMGGGSERTLDVIGTNLYSKNRPMVMDKESLQNTMDEYRDAGLPPDVPIYVVANQSDVMPVLSGGTARARSVTVKDFGRGLTPEMLYTKFTDIGETGKAGKEGSIGGFGVAKAAPLLGGKYARVESVVEENGQKVMYSFEGTPKQLKNQKVGVPLVRMVMQPSKRTGFTVKTYYGPDEYNVGELSNYTKNIAERSYVIKNPIKMIDSYGSNGLDDLIDNDFVPQNAGQRDIVKNADVYQSQKPEPIQDTITPTGAKIEIRYEDNPRHTSSEYKLHILNNGMYQSSMDLGYGAQLDNVPKDIMIDVHATVEEGEEGYPFTLNREQLDSSLMSEFRKWIRENIVTGALKKKEERMKKMYAALDPIKLSGTTIRPTFLFDSGDRLTAAEKMGFKLSNKVQQATRFFDDLIAQIAGQVDNAHNQDLMGDKLEKTGLLLSEPSTYGIYIPNPDRSLTSPKAAIGINWLSPIEIHAVPFQSAVFSVVTALHEVAHLQPYNPSGFAKNPMKDSDDPNVAEYYRLLLKEMDEQGGLNAGHNEEFMKRLGEVFHVFGPKKTFAAARELDAIISDGHGKYDPAVLNLLQVYQRSRGRPATTEDLLSSTGIKQATKSGRGGKSEGDDNSGEEKASSGAISRAVANLMEALESVRDTIGEQQEINRSERASRFKNFERTKGSGIDWASKAFSKMKGEHEKADYFSEKQLSKKDVNTLFSAIKNAKVPTQDKVKAVSGMFKILNGDAPVQSEVNVLDDIFGGGFRDKIVQMHGGIGGFGPIRVKIAETANTMKAMKSMLDVSAALRQGAGLALSPGFSKNGIQFINPAYRDAFQMMFKFFYDKEAYNAAMQAIIDDPDYIGARRAGLFLAKPGNLIKAEEAFGKNLIGYLPRWLGVPAAEEASERAYTGFLNMLRFQTYKNLIKNAKDAGHIMEKTKQLRDKKGDFKLDEDGNVKTTSEPTKIAKDIAYYINVTTGRGSLGKLEKIVPELNVVLWSPRNVSSRLTMLNPMYYKGLSNFARFEAMKSLFSIAAIATTLLALAKLRGAKISGNVLSADFGKARMPASGDKPSSVVVDPYTGLQQVVVAAARLTAESHRMVTGGKRAYNQENLLGIAGNFLANKESPIASFAHDLATAQSINFNDRSYVNKYGQKKNINPEIANTIMPMIIQDATDVFKSDAKFADQVGLDAVSLLGVGVQNYPETKPQTSKFRKMSIPNR